MTVNGTADWDNASTIAGAGTTTIAAAGTLTAPGADYSERFLDTGTLRIEGTATLEGNDRRHLLLHLRCRTAPSIEVGLRRHARPPGRPADLPTTAAAATRCIHVLAGGTLTRTSAAGTGVADVQVPVENDGTVTAASGTT